MNQKIVIVSSVVETPEFALEERLAEKDCLGFRVVSATTAAVPFQTEDYGSGLSKVMQYLYVTTVILDKA